MAAEDEEAPTRPERSVQNEAGHTMEAPEDDEGNEEVEDEMKEEEESEEPSSSMGQEQVAPRRRGTEAEREAMMENDIFRPSLSDMVAEDLVNFGLRPQQLIENNEANSGRGWFVLGSIQAMLPWGEDGIPFNEEEFEEFRRRLLNEGHGPEVSLTLACKNLNEFIRELEYQRDPALRQEIKDARNTLKLTHHLHEEEPRLISMGILGHFGVVLFGSVVMGVAAGALLSWFPDYEIAGMFLGAYLTFSVTQLLGLSGITALFCFGVVLAHYNWYNLSEPSKVSSKVIFGTIAKLAEAGVFVYLGVVAALSIGRFHWHGGCIFFALLAIIVARAAHVFPLSLMLNLCRRTRKISNNMSVVMWVSGLRGAIAFALSLRVPCEGREYLRGSEACRNSDLLVTTTISIVLATTMVVGTAMEKIATALSVIEPIEPGPLESLSEPLARQAEGADEHMAGSEMRSEASSSGRWALPPNWSLPIPSLRFHSRGHLYQAFARFDLEVLQPTFGGPCQNLEMPKYEAEEDDAPLQSRAVIFE
eukprot:g29895.t1